MRCMDDARKMRASCIRLMHDWNTWVMDFVFVWKTFESMSFRMEWFSMRCL